MTKVFAIQPLLAGPESMVLSDDEYFRTYPSVKAYLSMFEGIETFKDLSNARLFLSQHNQSQGTFGNYRGFIERLLLWSWIYAGKASFGITSKDFFAYLAFCGNPPLDWVGNAPKSRFIDVEGNWIVNLNWRPMDTRSLKKFSVTENGTLSQNQSICSSFFNFLHCNSLSVANPIKRFRGMHGRHYSSMRPQRNMIDRDLLQVVISELKRQATILPDGERALFFVASALYLYLRPSDLAIKNNVYPLMNVFGFDGDNWWFTNYSRNPIQRVPVPYTFLPYLIRYRVSRGLSPLPNADERMPLLETIYGRPGLRVRQINLIVKDTLAEVCRALSITGLSRNDMEIIKSLSLRYFREIGAKLDALSRSPSDLQQRLGCVSIAYVYGRYYAE